MTSEMDKRSKDPSQPPADEAAAAPDEAAIK